MRLVAVVAEWLKVLAGSVQKSVYKKAGPILRKC